MPRILPLSLFAVWAIWLMLIWGHGRGWSWISADKGFERAGQFGDAFGSLNALMASLAAAGAFLTLREQRLAAVAQDEFAREQSFETTLFQIMNSLQTKTNQIEFVEEWSYDGFNIQRRFHRGSAAFKYFVDKEVRNKIYGSFDWKSISKLFKLLYDSQESNLGHYFRMAYHVMMHVDRGRDFLGLEERYRYVRILRAQLSHSELLLILMNCRFGKGKGKFFGLATAYDLFQNLKESNDPLAKSLCKRLPSPDPGIVSIQEADEARSKVIINRPR